MNKQKIDFFPNPSSGVVHILADEIIELVQVFDMMGKQIASSKGSSTNFNLDLASYPFGKYIVKIQMSSKVEMFSVVKSE